MPVIQESSSETWLAVLEERIAAVRKAQKSGDAARAVREGREIEATAEIVSEELTREFHLAISKKGV